MRLRLAVTCGPSSPVRAGQRRAEGVLSASTNEAFWAAASAGKQPQSNQRAPDRACGAEDGPEAGAARHSVADARTGAGIPLGKRLSRDFYQKGAGPGLLSRPDRVHFRRVPNATWDCPGTSGPAGRPVEPAGVPVCLATGAVAVRLGAAGLLLVLGSVRPDATDYPIRLVEATRQAGIDLLNVSGDTRQGLHRRRQRQRRRVLRLRQRRRPRRADRQRLHARAPRDSGGDPMVALYRNDGTRPVHATSRRASGLTRRGWGTGVVRRRLRQRRLPGRLRHGVRAERAVAQQRQRHVRRRHAAGRRRRHAVEHRLRVRRLRPRRLRRPLRRQLRGVRRARRFRARGTTGSCRFMTIDVFCGPTRLPGEPDVLYRNNGDGTFTDVTQRAPASPTRATTASACCSPISTTTAGRTSTWPTIRCPTCCSATAATARSSRKALLAGVARERRRARAGRHGRGRGRLQRRRAASISSSRTSRTTTTRSTRTDGAGFFTDVSYASGHRRHARAVPGLGRRVRGPRQRRPARHLRRQRPRLSGRRRGTGSARATCSASRCSGTSAAAVPARRPTRSAAGCCSRSRAAAPRSATTTTTATSTSLVSNMNDRPTLLRNDTRQRQPLDHAAARRHQEQPGRHRREGDGRGRRAAADGRGARATAATCRTTTCARTSAWATPRASIGRDPVAERAGRDGDGAGGGPVLRRPRRGGRHAGPVTRGEKAPASFSPSPHERRLGDEPAPSRTITAWFTGTSDTRSVWPLGQRISSRSTRARPEAEVGAQVVLAQIAAAGFDFPHLDPRARRQPQRAPMASRLLLRADQAHAAGRCRGGRRRCSSRSARPPLLVTSRSRSPSLSMSPVTSARPTRSTAKPGPGLSAHVAEAGRAGVLEQQLALRVLRPARNRRDVVDHVAVDDGEVESAVVVVVERTRRRSRRRAASPARRRSRPWRR